MKFKESQFRLKLKGKTAVFIDWANVYYWKDSLKWDIDLKKLFDYLKSYAKIKEIIFYFGTDRHPASKQQIKNAEEIGYRVVTKPVKYLPKKTENGKVIWVRKCDFDLEIGLDCFERLEKFNGFIFFSGDGDFATLYKRLIKRKKQVIVGRLGKEVRLLRKGMYLCVVKKFRNEIQKYPPAGGEGHN
ncbi:MAG: NYN domain-containing protein [Microgenomates group bacterium]